MPTLKHLKINSFGENLVYLNRYCTAYQIEILKDLTKVEVAGEGRSVFGLLQIIDDEALINPDELGLNTEAFNKLGLEEGSGVSLALCAPVPSLNSIRRKMAGNVLAKAEYNAILADIESGKYSNMDIVSFLVASGSFMTAPEVHHLTEALIGSNTISWDEENLVVDHHCLGGIPGNKTDIIIAAIVAAYGMAIPKVTSRSLTAAAGVADVMNVLATVDIDEQKLKKAVRECRGAIACYDGLDIANVNKTLSAIERQIGIVQQEHVVSSILAIKAATGVTNLLVDIPVGPQARVKTADEAMKMRKLLEYAGDKMGLDVDVVITDGSEPIGYGIGPVLEARDIMKILRNKDDAPQDLLGKSIFLAGRVLEFDPNLRGGQGAAVAKELLVSGKALEALNRIIQVQGKSPNPQLGNLTRDVIADQSGIVESIDNMKINKLAILAGANRYPGAGLDLVAKTGDTVRLGDVLYSVYSCNPNDFAFANAFIEADTGYVIK